MDATVQKVLVDLKIVSLVQPKGRLQLVDEALAVENASMMTPIKRFLFRQNRILICQRIRQRVVELETLLQQKQIDDSWILDEVVKLIEPLKQGVNNLKETYSTDSQVCVNLELITARINHLATTYLMSSN